MYKVQFRNPATGRLETYRPMTRDKAAEIVQFADTLAERAVSELRVQTPAADRFGPVWADVTHEF